MAHIVDHFSIRFVDQFSIDKYTNWNKADRAKGYEVKYVMTNSKGKVKKNVYHINKTNHLIKLNTKPYPVKKVTATIRAYNYSKKGSKQYGTGASVHV